VKLGYKPIF